jgi:hypothetical protein
MVYDLPKIRKTENRGTVGALNANNEAEARPVATGDLLQEPEDLKTLANSAKAWRCQLSYDTSPYNISRLLYHYTLMHHNNATSNTSKRPSDLCLECGSTDRRTKDKSQMTNGK